MHPDAPTGTYELINIIAVIVGALVNYLLYGLPNKLIIDASHKTATCATGLGCTDVHPETATGM